MSFSVYVAILITGNTRTMIKQNVWKISEYFIQFFSFNYSTLCFHTTFSSWFWLIFDIMKMLWKHVLKIFWTSKCFSFDMNFNYTDWKESSTSGKLISDTPPKKSHHKHHFWTQNMTQLEPHACIRCLDIKKWCFRPRGHS